MSSVLHFSEASSLALHAIIMMAGKGSALTTTREIAAAITASEAHLAKVMQRLTKVGILRSTRGPKGGFQLVKPLIEVTLLDIYEAVEGPMPATACLFSHPKCDGKRCVFGDFVSSINRQIRDYLAETNLSQYGKAAVI